MIEDDDEPTGKAKGGHARRDALPPERRSEIARQAAEARWKAEPLQLTEDAETGDRFVLYARSRWGCLELRFEGDEPWATQRQMAELFGVTQQNIAYHVGQLLKIWRARRRQTSSQRNFVHCRRRQIVPYTDIQLGHDPLGWTRVNSKQGVMFRRWAREIERKYLLKGFVIDTPRLEDPDGRPDHFAELLAKVRHIRSSEKRMWTRVLELASFCSDYGLMTDDDRESFFATIQNAMHWSVTQQTAAEVIHTRVDAMKENAGVVTFKGEIPTVAEAQVAKNLYGPTEIEALNLVTSMTLEFFESQAEQRRPTTIAQFLEKMRDL